MISSKHRYIHVLILLILQRRQYRAELAGYKSTLKLLRSVDRIT